MGASGHPFEVQILPGLRAFAPPEETGSTFEGNAALKAAYYSRFTHHLTLADDSGLEVTALDGAPGIFSARYAGPHATDEENNRMLLKNLEPHSNRTARFVSVVAIAQLGEVIASALGTVEGAILPEPRGDGGFGYDPLFFYPPFGGSFAEITDEQKLSVSARGIALRAALGQIVARRPQ